MTNAMTNAETLRNKVSRGTLERENLLEAQAEKVEMTLNTDSAIASGLLIQRLTELYEDPVEASVRETISNGLDAVTEFFSGDRPEIHITSPTSLNPIFIVKDNGVGMSYEDLKNIYSKYGASTKMNNFEQIGAYGLGAKAPLAYGTEFTVSSVKDGVRTTIIVAREELTNYIKIIDSSETTDSSGTTVSIPVTHYDLNRFSNHIQKYKLNPIDKKGVTLFIDGEEIVKSDFIEIADDVVIFRKDGEEVTARMWIQDKDSSIVEVMSSMSESDVRNTLSYVIGGWAYKAPHRRGYHSNSSMLMVELKAGIVGFNSSRDAMLENERYTELEDLVVEYVKSSNFVDKIIKAVNESEINTFKKVVNSLLNREERSIVIENGKISVKKNDAHSSRYKIARDYSISDFIHEETGFSVDHILKDVPSNDKQTFIVVEQKESFRKTINNGTFVSKEIGLSSAKSVNSKEINSMLNSVMYDESESQSLEDFLIHLSLNGYKKSNHKIFVTFVTDIEADPDEDEKTTDFSRLRSGRKTIIKMRGSENENQYLSYVVYTENTKKDIDKMIETAKLNDLDIEVHKSSDLVEKMSEYRKANRTQTQRVKNQISTSISKYDHESDSSSSIQVSEIEVKKGVQNLIILGKQRTLRAQELKQIHSWYCNTKKVKSDEVAVYASIGNHRIAELETLMELGELHQAPHTEASGLSTLYDEVVKKGEVKYHIINNNDPEVEKKAFLQIISTIQSGYGSTAFEDILVSLKITKEKADLAGLEMNEIPSEKINELSKCSIKEFGGRYRSSRSVDNNSLSHLVSLITDEQKEIIENMSILNRFDKIAIINKDNTVTEFFNHSQADFSNELIEKAFSKENETKAHMGFIRNQFENYLKIVNKFIEDFSALKVG